MNIHILWEFDQSYYFSGFPENNLTMFSSLYYLHLTQAIKAADNGAVQLWQTARI